MRRLKVVAVVLIVGAVALVGTAQASVITNTFDLGQAPPPGGSGPTAPAAPTAANGVHALGVTFGFTEGGNPSSAAMYGVSVMTGPNELAPLSDPVLDGPADGVLTLVFDTPTTFLSFDIAFMTPTGPGGQVTVGGNSQPISTTGNSGVLGLFSIGSFSWTPAAPFLNATITFDSAASSTQFAIDNLSYDDPPAGTPEPGCLILVGSGLVMGLAVRKRR
jgi:hypothetical protein